MSADSGKNPLPSGPSNLCFNKEEFMKNDFNTDQFVMECRRHVSLETLRDDLLVYLKVLRSAMIELINKDYADFVNLSTNLVGMDKAIGNLSTPLGQLKEEVLSVQKSMDDAMEHIEEKMKRQKQIRDQKVCLQRLMSVSASVEKMERLLGIAEDHGSGTQYTGELTGHLIERVASEFNKLQFNVNKTRGHPLVETIRPRISNITTTLQYSLEGSFRDSLDQGQTDILRQCLRIYGTIDKMRDAEALFRQHIVRPYMQEVLTEQYIQANPHGLRGMYNKALEFIPKHCKQLKEVTSGTAPGSEAVKGYDFLVNSVWPEIVSNIEARTPSIFAPGNPDVFHEKYTISMDFVDRFERQCGSQASVKRLRAHPSFSTFMTKWSLPVYFQIRFQDIAGSFELALETGLNNAAEDSKYHLHATDVLATCLRKCWQNDVFLIPLCHRFWKLTLQHLSRYATWIEEVKNDELNRKPVVPKAKKPGVGEQVAEPEGPPPPPPITMGQIVCLVTDAELICNQISEMFDEIMSPKLALIGCHDNPLLTESLNESKVMILAPLPVFNEYIVDDITNQCSVHLKLVNDIPRLYRKTNRDIPSKASNYICNIYKPIKIFVSEHQGALSKDKQIEIITCVLNNILKSYYGITSDLLTSVKKMEDSLKRLKKARKTDKSAGTTGMSDDDKIRLQLSIDVTEFKNQFEELNLEASKVEDFKKMQDLVESARTGVTT
ncbi:unnamed protein product [Owenia fusiformis]|uniref:Conserved oligomeric Golgi complex subunit 2 n=1 Tax=Owenia fusiformis TaxID=6347 RepID=A0A8J1U4A6_OWEFU|nr:unnamed protein product [Owenia fusiformis]